MKLFLSLSICLIFLTNSSLAQHLVGPVTDTQIREIQIFDLYTKRYQPKKEIVEQLNSIQDSILVDVFMGTWCHDSKREVPTFMKLMEDISNTKINARYTALEIRRRGPLEIIKQNDIKRTPTFIVYRNGQEIGRIIEKVKVSIEEDLLNILKDEKTEKK